MRLRRSAEARIGTLTGSVIALAVHAATGAATDPVNPFDWMAPAKVVVVAALRSGDDPRNEFEVLRVARGKLSPGSRLLVQAKAANRDRAPNTAALRFEAGKSYVLLLAPSARQKADGPPRYDLVRGVEGAREVPGEGAAAFIDAVVALAEIQALGDDERIWFAVRGLLEDPNPYLIRTSLDLLIRYGRVEAADSGRMRPLLDHPRPDVRESAARLLGRILALPGTSDPAERAVVFGELAARARRDASVVVRVAATESVSATGAAGVEELLKEIARDDPDQSVRYVAQRALFERRSDGSSPPPRSN